MSDVPRDDRAGSDAETQAVRRQPPDETLQMPVPEQPPQARHEVEHEREVVSDAAPRHAVEREREVVRDAPPRPDPVAPPPRRPAARARPSTAALLLAILLGVAAVIVAVLLLGQIG